MSAPELVPEKPPPTRCAERALFGDGPGGTYEGGLQPAGGVQMVARPDHAYGGCGGPAVLTVQVLAHRVDKATVSGLVVGERLAHLSGSDETGREVVLPRPHPLAGRQQLPAGGSSVAADSAVFALPEVQHRVRRSAK